ncbi:Murein DD-endopeptidase MepM and murein hydrolase activator NlpD, contain LysM domain [Saccharicrinis carchari]|uniref:Murein DD-endopeptidase MepM and murein hydrolase activator NlpD, contain LysM domain n=1 Tax=Saccharicrinis carchari TaxID=1168039 RepID=A0A521F1T0_SACCC|nr:M23 family metallopeptidase [Saccharicrinis carchari]SMO90158.1 Murein DD-endopeptidase MepM and murein hydrolase activator NlpD, contain LysM domain [Saccharicrinis carchari]
MAKVKFRYNPDSLSYDKIETGMKYYLSRTLFYFFFGSVLGLLYFFAYSYLLDSPKELRLKRENARLTTQFEIMSQRLDQTVKVLDDIQRRDENIYRVIFQADSIPNSIRKAGFGGVNRYEQLQDLENAELVMATAKKLDVVMKQAYVQSKSFDEIIEMAKKNEEMIKSIPAIMPLSNKDLKRTASGWGYRIHPIYKTRRFHSGMDFTAPTGTEIYATGDGTVSKITREKTGYGNRIEIDHGFGFTTLYAHLSDFNVRRGQKVKRGEVIGYVGNTGTSTAPHLHYEVHVKNKKVNPSHYYFNDLSAEEYEEMIKISSISNQTFD